MIGVSKEDQINSDRDVSVQFFDNTLGEEVGARVIAGFMAVSSLGNIIVMTYTAVRVKQEIAKEGVLPFSRFFARNTNISKRLTRLLGQRSFMAEPTPNGALLLHWVFANILILATWSQESANDSYAILVSLYTYCSNALFFFIVAGGLLCLRLYRPFSTNSWHNKSSFPYLTSVTSAAILTIVTAFPLVALWIPPSSTSSGSTLDEKVIEDLTSSYPWFTVPVVSWSVVGFGIVYWIAFRFILPRTGNRKGKELVVERRPFFRLEHNYYIQWHEIVELYWQHKL